MPSNNFNIEGLTANEVLKSRETYGRNVVSFKRQNPLFAALKSILSEPMVLLLLVAACIYFVSGKLGDGLFLTSAIILVAAISLYQDSRSRSAIEKLKQYTQPVCKVIRDGAVTEIASEELVIGDALIVDEGTLITADGAILHSNDFSVNESILTGESLSVYKDKSGEDNRIYCGTSVTSGLAIATITAIAGDTRLGKIGKSLESIKEEKTPLELQIGSFVKSMAIIGALVFVTVWGINYFRSKDVLDSLLKALTLAMSILPEEIPVAFTTFMALGAWRLMQMGIVVKQMKTVETLGSATVICTDKTGTLTENRMSLAALFHLDDSRIVKAASSMNEKDAALIRLGMWASEPIPFDPMEVALHESYIATAQYDERPQFKMVHEYPLGGKPPMMTHLFEDAAGTRIIAAKGAPEAFLNTSGLNDTERAEVLKAVAKLASEGYRVLGVAAVHFDGNDYPAAQQDFKFSLKGLVAFYDPPKHNIAEVLQKFYTAGVAVKIVTGDNAATTTAIAQQIKFIGSERGMTGDDLMKLSDKELQDCVMDTNVYTRMFPEAKLRIMEALKAKQQIVAMIGDGVNDGPALKAAHIGIAMGKKGTEIAKQAASLVLVEDDLSKMVDAIAMGRKIYANLKKAVQYIISIHIPIILTVFIPLLLGWIYPNIFSPVHVIFLELIMGPTCSIIYENEPMEANTLQLPPCPFTTTFFRFSELATSVVQGLVIAAGTLSVYQYGVYLGYSEELTRSVVFSTLIFANVFLTLINRSFYYSVFTTMFYKNVLLPIALATTLLLLVLLLYVPLVADFFQLRGLSPMQLLMSVSVGFLSVIWFELVKWFHRRKTQS
ncbi:MAG: cation-translocating P-type ATPase [Bacteroidetes bacterium]|nr:cation-translocating P-type ATPase [Bacteroidota bacterium]